MTDEQAKKRYFILAVLFGAATLVGMTLWVIFEQLGLWVAIVGAIITAGPCTVFVMMYASYRRRIILRTDGIDGEGIITEVGITLNTLSVEYTYADEQGRVHTKREFLESVKPEDIDLVKALNNIPIRYFGKIGRMREAEIFDKVQDAKNLTHDDLLLQERAIKSINRCSRCRGLIDLERNVCKFCDTAFVSGEET